MKIKYFYSNMRLLGHGINPGEEDKESEKLFAGEPSPLRRAVKQVAG
jgi:hypothetical protein